jgi:PAS domain S-box-containing protein
MSESRPTLIVVGRKPAPKPQIEEPAKPVESHGPDFAFLANSIPQLVWTSDANGQCDYFNQRWFDYTGSTFEQSVGNGWQYAIHPEDLTRTLSTWAQAKRNGQECVVEHRIRHRSGEYRWNLTKAMPMRRADGVIVRWFGTCTDIHDHKHADELQHQRTRDVAKAKLASQLAHQINNPLNATMNLLYLSQIFPRKSKGFIRKAEEQVQKIAAITAEILNQK